MTITRVMSVSLTPHREQHDRDPISSDLTAKLSEPVLQQLLQFLDVASSSGVMITPAFSSVVSRGEPLQVREHADPQIVHDPPASRPVTFT